MKIGITLLSLMMLGICYGDEDRHPDLREILGAVDDNNNGNNINQDSFASRNQHFKSVIVDGVINGILFCFYGYFVAKLFIGLLGWVTKRGVETRIEQQHASKLRRLNEKKHEDFTDILSNEKNELISRLERVYSL